MVTGSCLENKKMQGTMSGACRRRRPRTARMDNIKTWTGLSAEESIRMTEDRDKWRRVPRCDQRSDRGRLKNRREPGGEQLTLGPIHRLSLHVSRQTRRDALQPSTATPARSRTSQPCRGFSTSPQPSADQPSTLQKLE